ncbi:MAG: hypothetical protein MCM46_13085 [Candidatus Manganitrophus sp. SB1]|nr:hypothetical protein [Candidatus Manganitrophus morganii]
MILIDLFVALIIGLILTLIFWPRFRASGSWSNWAGVAGFLWFFILVFLASWLGGVWITPAGPRVWGVSPFPFLLMGLLFALLLAATAPIRPPRARRQTLAEAREEPTVEEGTFVVLNFFYWILLIALLVSILARYGA